MKQRKLLWVTLLLCIAAAAITFVLTLKFSEELRNLKQRAYNKLVRITTREAESDIDFSDFAPRVYQADAWFLNNRMISHACGGIDGITYTNSREALEKALERGHRIIEVDFAFTTDGTAVCVHNWAEFGELVTGQNWHENGGNQGCSYEFFRNLRICGRYSTLSAREVLEVMTEYPDLYIMVDTKYSLEDVVKALVALDPGEEVLNRILIQVYGPGEKAKILEIHPFPEENFLLTVYKMHACTVEDILSLCRDENIFVVTTPMDYLSQEDLAVLREKNLIIFQHTTNRLDIAKLAINSGIQGVYTDFLTPDLLA